VTAEELEILVVRLLERGVPHNVVADVLELDPELVRSTQKHVRVERYGTDDLGGYLEQMRWDAIDEARRVIKSGSAAEKKNVLGAVLGKEMAVSARRTPEAVRDSQDAVLGMLEAMRSGKAKPKEAGPSKFNARREPESA
jgi:hypothetical protein